ncbi:hypothetical protein QSI_1628 [Clostridioides difficile P28]|nr:hypothetical protein QSI_1628 [Clostridioides difficile P28]
MYLPFKCNFLEVFPVISHKSSERNHMAFGICHRKVEFCKIGVLRLFFIQFLFLLYEIQRNQSFEL